jgi:hypothetical protein
LNIYLSSMATNQPTYSHIICNQKYYTVSNVHTPRDDKLMNVWLKKDGKNNICTSSID